MERIEQEINKLEWRNDKGNGLPNDQQVIAVLVALDEIAEQLANINQVLNHHG